MKRCHVAALALAVWYLMLPPLRRDGMVNPLAKAEADAILMCACGHQQAAHNHTLKNAGPPTGAYIQIGRCLTCDCAGFSLEKKTTETPL